MKFNILIARFLLAVTFGLAPSIAAAEQKQMIGRYEVHYIVIPTTFLQAQIADKYNLTRSKDRSLINISVLDRQGSAVEAQLAGRSRNLLEQIHPLTFHEVREGSAIYYLATLRHANEEHHRLAIDIQTSDGKSGTLKWQQKLYWEE